MITLTTGKPGAGMTLTALQTNAGPWRAIAEFLDAQHLASFGLRRLSAQCGADRGELATHEAAPRVAHPVGNTGTTSQPLPVRHGAALPAPFGVLHRG